MKSKFQFKVAFIAIVLIVGTAIALNSAYADDTDGIAYLAILSALETNYAEASAHDSAQVRLVPYIKSRLPDVVPEKIELTLCRDDDRVRIPVNPDGSIELPIEGKWKHEDSWIESNQPQGSLVLSLMGHLCLGKLSGIEKNGTCTLQVRQLFPSDAISDNAKDVATNLFPGSKPTISFPAFESIQLRNDRSDSPQVRLLAGDADSEVGLDSSNSFTVPQAQVASHRGGLVELSPSTGWRWRAKPVGIPWTTWENITPKQEEAEQ